MSLWTLFLSILSFGLLYACWKLVESLLYRRKFFKILQEKSKSKNLTILPTNFGIGQFMDILSLSEKGYKYWSEESYKGDDDTAVLNFLMVPYLLTSSPEMVKQVTITNRLPKSTVIYDTLKPIFGNGILLSSGELWKNERTLINPIFTPQNVKSFIKTMEFHTNKALKNWKKQGKFEFCAEMSTLTLEIISESAFGDTSEQRETARFWHDLTKNFFSVMTIGALIPMSIVPYLPLPSVKKTFNSQSKMKEIIKKLMKERRVKIENGTDDAGDLLSLLMTAEHDGNKIPDELVIDESFTFLFAGHDTTSSLVSNTIFMLCAHQDIQEKLRTEILSAVGDKEHISYEDIENLTYLQQVVNESFRMIPPVPEIDRETEKDMFVGDMFVPKGTIIGINIYGLHHNPKIWKDPYSFNPDRWNEDNLKDIPNLRYSFIPFSVGPRDCVGKIFAKAEGPLILSLILRNFKVEFDDGFSKDDVILDFESIVRPKELKVKLTTL
eukprot:gene11887-5214_t